VAVNTWTGSSELPSAFPKIPLQKSCMRKSCNPYFLFSKSFNIFSIFKGFSSALEIDFSIEALFKDFKDLHEYYAIKIHQSVSPVTARQKICRSDIATVA
jgi:hypothetical protein